MSGAPPRRVRVGPGRGHVVHRRGVVAVVELADQAAADVVSLDDGLVEVLLEQASGGPSFVALASLHFGEGSGCHLTVRGDVTCTIGRTSGPGEVIRGVDGTRTIELPGDVTSVMLALDSARDGADPIADLRDGVVPGAVAEVVLDAYEPPTALMPPVVGLAPAPLPPPEPRVNVLLEPLDDADVRAPLPMATADADAASAEEIGARPPVVVRGLACNVGHVNRLDAPYCSSCGRRLQGTVNLVEGPRPSLGTLIFDDGTAYGLDSGYVVGRDPGGADAVTSGAARSIALADPGRTLSRVHAEFRLEGWDVVLVDHGSANGTFVAPPGVTEWARIDPGVPVTLAGGTSVALGRRTLVFQQR